MKQLGFLCDTARCTGCKACQVACKEKNKLETGTFFRRVDTVETTMNNERKKVYFSAACNHCENPSCVEVCPVGAMYVAKDGTVQCREEKCIGCGRCVKVCPSKAIFLDKETGHARKCDSCADLRREGRSPACVEACPMRALTFGWRDVPQKEPMWINPVTNPVKRGKKSRITIQNIEDAWKQYSRFARFFYDFSSWKEISGGWTAEYLNQEYDDLFKGTNASVYIPLWASVCLKKEGCLLDETTLKIVQEYHKWGYRPIPMDGNPPDYIGQQLRFVCYLLAGALYDKEHGISPNTGLLAAEEFISLYLQDTICSVVKGIQKYAQREEFLHFADELDRLVYGESIAADQTKASPECYETYLNGREAAIENALPTEILTGGHNNCGGKCSIRVTVQDGCLTHLESGCDIGDPTIRACVRGRGYRKTYLAGERLRYPMKRIGARGEGHFQRISWEEAADLLAAEWIRIRDTYGPGSRYVLYSTGVSAVMRPDDLTRRLLNLDGGHLGAYGTYSSACTDYVTSYIYGHSASGSSAETIPDTRFLILWGHNPAETIFSPNLSYMITKAKENGAKVVVIDPRQSDTAIGLADQWIPIRPATDGALAAAMAYVIWSEGLQNQHFMDTYCLGFDAAHMPEGVPAELNYHSYLFGELDGIVKTPEWAETITGIPAAVIQTLAREYATAKPACLLPGLGNQRTGNGEQTTRAMAMLTCLTGNVGISGGGAAGCGTSWEEDSPWFPVGENGYPGSISFFMWTKAIEEGINMTAKKDGVKGMEQLDSNIKMLFNLAGNVLINQHSDINNSIRILKDTSKCEFIVCSDVFMTPSAKFADLLLPAPSFLEDDNIAAPWDSGHYLVSNNKTIDPLFGCRTEYDWLSDTAKRLCLWEAWSEGRTAQGEWLEHLYNELRKCNRDLPDYSVFKKNGGHTYRNAVPYIAFADQIRDPEHCKFSTPSGKIEIFSKRLYEMNNPTEIPAIPSYVPCPEGSEDPLREIYPLQLIGWHTKRRTHSTHDNNPWLEEAEPQRMWMHPEDAVSRGISDGDIAEVYNSRGRLRIPVTVTTRIIKGVVAIPQGAWYTPGEDGIDTRGSINVLTSTRPTPLAKGNPQHTNLVEVCRYLSDKTGDIM